MKTTGTPLSPGTVPTDYVPFTPGGSMVVHLISKSEEAAWVRLVDDVRRFHGDIVTRKWLKVRGYTVGPLPRGVK